MRQCKREGVRFLLPMNTSALTVQDQPFLTPLYQIMRCGAALILIARLAHRFLAYPHPSRRQSLWEQTPSGATVAMGKADQA
jgi:hypothetical protein